MNSQYLPIFLACYILWTLPLQADSLWPARIAPQGVSVDHCFSVTTTEAQLAIFGTNAKGQLAFALFNEEGKLLAESQVKAPKARFYAACQTERGFLLTGSLLKNAREYPAAWTLSLDGQRIKNLPLDLGDSEGRFKAIKAFEGQYYLSGHLGTKMLVIQLDADLRRLTRRYTHLQPSTANALSINRHGEVFVAGMETEDGLSYAMTWKFDGQLRMRKQHRSQLEKTEALGLLVLQDGDIVVSGRQEIERFRTDAFVERLRPNCTTRWFRPYENEGKCWAKTILQTADDELLIGGYQLAFGARKKEIWQMKISLQGTLIEETGEQPKAQLEELKQWVGFLNGDHLALSVGKGNIHLQHYKYAKNLCNTSLPSGQHLAFKLLTKQAIATGDQPLQYRAQVLSRNPLVLGRDVHIERQLLGVKSAATTADLIGMKQHQTVPGQYCYELSHRIGLENGKNRVITTIQQQNQIYRDSLEIFRLPERPDLHLLSIGITSKGLAFTEKDARDFAALLKDQEGRLYGAIHQGVLASQKETTARNISDQLRQLQKRVEADSATIKPSDVLILFISSHGDLKDDQFWLLGSDHQQGYDRTSINFKREILDVLKGISCRKLIFIDACKSGGSAKGVEENNNRQLATAILKVLYTSPGLTRITSSQEGQNSYEINKLENGAFTAAIKEALTYKQRLVDVNGDLIITIGELFGFISSRVPQLVQEYYDSSTLQMPSMPDFELREDYPLFVISY